MCCWYHGGDRVTVCAMAARFVRRTSPRSGGAPWSPTSGHSLTWLSWIAGKLRPSIAFLGRHECRGRHLGRRATPRPSDDRLRRPTHNLDGARISEDALIARRALPRLLARPSGTPWSSSGTATSRSRSSTPHSPSRRSSRTRRVRGGPYQRCLAVLRSPTRRASRSARVEVPRIRRHGERSVRLRRSLHERS